MTRGLAGFLHFSGLEAVHVVGPEFAYFSGEEDHADDVGKGHAEEHHVGEVDDALEGEQGAEYGDEYVDDAVGPEACLAEEVFGGAFAVVGPGDEGGVGEDDDSDEEEVLETAVDAAESAGGDFDAAKAFCVEVYTGAEDSEGGHGADDDGVDEGTEHSDDTFADGLVGFGSGVGDGGRADTGFVGEGGAFHAGDEYAEEATPDGVSVEGLGNDGHEHFGDGTEVDENDDGADGDVAEAHAGDEILGDFADTFDTTNDDDGDHGGEDEAGGNGEPLLVFEAEELCGDGVGLVGLEHVTAAEGCADGEYGEDEAEYYTEGVEGGDALFHAFFKVDHGSAEDVSVGFNVAVDLGEGAGGEFHAHAEKGGEPHPEDGAGPACSNGDGDTGDVTKADGGGKGGGEGLEVGDFAFVFGVVVFAADHIDGVAEEAEVDEAVADGEEEAAADEDDDDEGDAFNFEEEDHGEVADEDAEEVVELVLPVGRGSFCGFLCGGGQAAEQAQGEQEQQGPVLGLCYGVAVHGASPVLLG